MTMRRLTPDGIADLTTWVEQLRHDGRLEPPPLLSNDRTSQPVDFPFDSPDFVFGDRAELGTWLAERLRPFRSRVLYDEGFWSALALLLVDQVCPAKSGGERKPGEAARYVMDAKRKAYRHLLWAAWWAMDTYGDDGRYLLVPSLLGDYPLEFGGGEVMGQIAANQMTTAAPAVIRLGRWLYADPVSGRQRKGSSGKGAASPRRFVQVLRHFELTYDFSSANAEFIAALLPGEFASRLKEGTPSNAA